VLTFTLRDSPDCFINVSCWGGEQHVTGLASQFHIGHIGEIFFYILAATIDCFWFFKVKCNKC